MLAFPGSSYTRDYGVNAHDVNNVHEKVLRPVLKFAEDEVNLQRQQLFRLSTSSMDEATNSNTLMGSSTRS